jgi:integrase
MATLFKRSNGVYYLKVRNSDGKEVRQSLKTTSKKDARRIQQEVERELLHPEARPESVLSFQEAWRVYEQALAPHKKPKTLYNEKIAWTKFSDWAEAQGVTTLQSVRVGDIAQYQAGLVVSNRSNIGINSSMRACHIVVNHLIRLEVFDKANPFSKVSPLPEKRETKYLEWQTVMEMVGKAAEFGQDIHLVFILGAYAGLRKDEILRARWEHVDWTQDRLLVDGTKTTASRDYVPLHALLRASLEPYKQESGYIVKPTKAESKKQHSYRWNWRKQWAMVLKASEIECTPHQLRHSVATHLLDMGYTLQQVAVFLRHATDIPTRRYADLKGVKMVIDRF